ncbi:MAG: HAD hydrolase-like protein [bacterium]
MEKPILATNIDGLLLEHEVFIEPHKAWFKRAIEKTRDNSLEKWIGKENYFPGVIEAMKKIMPNASKEQQTRQARKWYQEDVMQYIKNNPKKIKKEIAEKLKSLKEKYQLILITTNSQNYINEILKVSNLEGIYNKIIASKIKKEPSKEELLNELIKKYGKPKYYLTGKPDEKITDKFKELGTKVLGISKINEIE